MELHLENDHQILIEDDEYLAVKQSDNIELWNREGDERYGVLPDNYTLDDIQRIMSFYRSGFANGEKFGQLTKLNEIRSSLNLQENMYNTMYQLWKRKTDGRFYEINLIQDLFGDWLICLAWGSQNVKPKGQTLLFDSLQSALDKLPELEKRRKSHKYKLMEQIN